MVFEMVGCCPVEVSAKRSNVFATSVLGLPQSVIGIMDTSRVGLARWKLPSTKTARSYEKDRAGKMQKYALRTRSPAI